MTAGGAKHLVIIVASKKKEFENMAAAFTFELTNRHLQFPSQKKEQADFPANGRQIDLPYKETTYTEVTPGAMGKSNVRAIA